MRLHVAHLPFTDFSSQLTCQLYPVNFPSLSVLLVLSVLLTLPLSILLVCLPRMRQVITDLDNEVKASGTKERTTAGELKQAQASLENLRCRLYSQEEDLAESAASNDALQEVVNGLQRQLTQAQADVSDLRDVTQEQEQDYDVVIVDTMRLMDQMAYLRVDLDQAMAGSAALQAEVATLHVELAQVKVASIRVQDLAKISSQSQEASLAAASVEAKQQEKRAHELQKQLVECRAQVGCAEFMAILWKDHDCAPISADARHSIHSNFCVVRFRIILVRLTVAPPLSGTVPTVHPECTCTVYLQSACAYCACTVHVQIAHAHCRFKISTHSAHPEYA